MIRPSCSEPKVTVLVIDEDRRIADSLAMALDISGFRATAAYTGQEAMALARTRPFDFIVSDTVAEIKGVKASLAISEVLPNSRVLVMSSNSDFAQVYESVRAQAYRFTFFAKPAHPGRLVEKLQEYALGL